MMQYVGRTQILALVAVLGSACGGPEAPVVAGNAGPAGTVRPVSVARATQGAFERTVTLTGTLAAEEQVDLSLKVTGRINEMMVDLGSPVRRGQVLARLSPTDFQLRLNQAEAALQQARARVGLPAEAADSAVVPETSGLVRQSRAVRDEARLTRDRVRTFVERGISSRADLEAAEAALEVAEGRYQDAIEEIRNRQAMLAQRRSEVALAQQQLDDTALRSPLDGAVRERHASVGEYRAAGTPVLTVVRVDPLRLRLAVPERSATALRAGQQVRVRAEGDARAYDGRLVRIGAAIDEANRTLPVEAAVSNREGTLRPGMFATADIVVTASEPALVVPADAIVTFAGVHKVLTVREGHARSSASGSAAAKAAGWKYSRGSRPAISWSSSLGTWSMARRFASRARGRSDRNAGARERAERHLHMKSLAALCIRRPVFAAMIVLSLAVVGAASYFRLGVDRFPRVDLPTVSVRTSLPGAAVEEIETQISEPMEEAVNTVEGISELRSVSAPGSSIVIAAFNLNRDIDTAAQDVRDRVAAVIRNLPLDTLPPVVSKFNNDSSPVMSVALSGNLSVRELTEVADKIAKPRLERATGVGEVAIVGGLERAINIRIEADRLAAYRLSIGDVRTALERQNADVPGGNVTSGPTESILRTMGRVTDPDAFNDLVIATVDGSPIRIRDIGRPRTEPRSSGPSRG